MTDDNHTQVEKHDHHDMPIPITNDMQSPNTSTEPPPPSTTHSAQPKSKSQNPTRTRIRTRARPRRRATSIHSDSDPERDSAGSLTSASEESDEEEEGDGEEEEDEDEEDEKAVEAAIGHDPPSSTSVGIPSVFADSLVTPVGWGNGGGDVGVEEIGFEQFNRGEMGVIRGRGGVLGRGRGRGGKIVGDIGSGRGQGEGDGEKKEEDSKEKKEFTPEQTRKFEERKAKMKERQKAKKLEVKEARRKAQEGGVAQTAAPVPTKPEIPVEIPAESSTAPKAAKAPKTRGKKATNSQPTAQPSISSIIASTSALTIDESTPPTSSTTTSHPPLSETKIDQTPSTSTTTPSQTNPPDTNPSRPPPQPTTREAYAQRIAQDPKFTPRVGNFWTHDQRHYEAGQVGEGGYAGLRGMSDFWRGRGRGAGGNGGFRGGANGIPMGFRGRGKGGFGPGPGFNQRGGFMQNGSRHGPGQGQPGQEVLDKTEESGVRKLEMDKVEAELEAKEAEKAAPPVKAEHEDWSLMPTSSSDPEAVMEGAVEVKQEIAEDGPVRVRGEKKWGHEGFESIQAVDQFRAGRNLRGRGVGRGFAFAGRGGFNNQVPFNRVPFTNSRPTGTQVNGSLPVAPSDSGAGTVETLPLPAENLSTQPASESLLAGQDNGVTVKLPGADALPDTPVSTNAVIANGSDAPTTHISSPPTTSSISQPPDASAPALTPGPFYPANGQASSLPFTAMPPSENGSMSSTGIAKLPTQPFQPISSVSTGTAEYYNSNPVPDNFRPSLPQHQHQYQPRPFYPNHNSNPNFNLNLTQRQFTPQPFYPHQQQQQPITYTPSPDPYAQHQHPHPQRNSFSGPTYYDNRGNASSPSPFNPYANAQYPGQVQGQGGIQPQLQAQGQVQGQSQYGGFFVPARSSKISIRAPGEHDKSEENDTSTGTNNEYASIATPPIQTPGPGQAQQGYYQEGYNPYVGVGVVGYGQEYGPPGGGAGWQQGYNGVQAGYGYEEYPGY